MDLNPRRVVARIMICITLFSMSLPQATATPVEAALEGDVDPLLLKLLGPIHGVGLGGDYDGLLGLLVVPVPPTEALLPDPVLDGENGPSSGYVDNQDTVGCWIWHNDGDDTCTRVTTNRQHITNIGVYYCPPNHPGEDPCAKYGQQTDGTDGVKVYDYGTQKYHWCVQWINGQYADQCDLRPKWQPGEFGTKVVGGWDDGGSVTGTSGGLYKHTIT